MPYYCFYCGLWGPVKPIVIKTIKQSNKSHKCCYLDDYCHIDDKERERLLDEE